jgi:hypothetical protein
LPIDKLKNSDRSRRSLGPVAARSEAPPRPAGVAPLLRHLMAEYAATGQPPAYIPHDGSAAADPETEEEES